LIKVLEHGKYELIGRTLDDSAGEAFDKVAKLLNLGFPGGPIIELLSHKGDSEAFAFPRPMIDRPNYDFSFSGLKTAVLTTVNKIKNKKHDINKPNIAASFQKAVIDVLVSKTIRAAIDKNISTITMSGGVAANGLLRKILVEEAEKRSMEVYYPDKSLCTDNGAMIASLAYYKYSKKVTSNLYLDAVANAPLGDKNVIYTNKDKK